MMGKPRKKTAATESPSMKKARSIKKKYLSPGKPSRARRALLAIEKDKVSIKKAAEQFQLSYGYLYRRWSGEVDIDKRKGPNPVFNKSEEEAMANWLKEMSERGMGLKPYEFMDFVQEIVRKEKRETPFIDGRPGYDWYYAFLERNEHIVQMRTETPLESSRAKLTKEQTDKWYANFRDFLISKDLIDKPCRIYNADESGFAMASVAGRVIGPSKTSAGSSQIPHVSGRSKQRFTVMYCAAADGVMLPPFFIYPEPKPRGYNPLTGSVEGSQIAYTKKGWMDAPTFQQFIEHFNVNAVKDRPVVLLVDSVSSHVSMSVFEDAKNKGIELYRLVPNATHLMQPLDKGVFGPLKQKWHQVVRQHNRANPGNPIGKENFAEKLKEAFLLFYKPLTVINAFKASGIYPVDSRAITKEQLKPGITFSSSSTQPESDEEKEKASTDTNQDSGAALALKALDSALTTPVKEKYKKRLEEGYDIEGQSPCFDVYKTLVKNTAGKSKPVTATVSAPQDLENEQSNVSALQLLAEAASVHESTAAEPSENTSSTQVSISAAIKESLVYPKDNSAKQTRKSQLDSLPHNLTSPESMRTMSLKELEVVKKFSKREQKAKQKYFKDKAKKSKLEEKKAKQKTTLAGSGKGLKKSVRQTVVKQKNVCEAEEKDDESAQCMKCKVTWNDEQFLGLGRVWVECDKYKSWVHSDCSTVTVPDEEEVPYYCHECMFIFRSRAVLASTRTLKFKDVFELDILILCKNPHVSASEPGPSASSINDESALVSSHATITLENSVIKGYHSFKIRPPNTDPKTRLIIDREYTNISDQDACLVWMPELSAFDINLYNMVTDRQRNLILSDIAGLPIGHVPRILASCFRTVLDRGGKVYATTTGDPVPSFPPWPAPSEKGGGVVIPCFYTVIVDNLDETVQMLSDTLSTMPEGSVMDIKVQQ